MKMTIHIKDDCGAILESAFNIASEAHAKGRYNGITLADVMTHYNKARSENLRYNRKTNVLRNDRLGVLSRPVDPSEWQTSSTAEAREYIAREVWCSAVAAYNRRNMS